jgi:hypothetical protein
LRIALLSLVAVASTAAVAVLISLGAEPLPVGEHAFPHAQCHTPQVRAALGTREAQQREQQQKQEHREQQQMRQEEQQQEEKTGQQEIQQQEEQQKESQQQQDQQQWSPTPRCRGRTPLGILLSRRPVEGQAGKQGNRSKSTGSNSRCPSTTPSEKQQAKSPHAGSLKAPK